MSSWALRRQLLFLLLPIFIFIGLGYVTYSRYIYQAPSCTDGKQNGIETGVDCGGVCQLVCSDQSIAPVVVWSKSFHVTGNVYNSVAYIQNPNNTSHSLQAPYEFRLFDNAGVLVATRQGSIDIEAGKTFAVFEGGIQINGKTVKRTDFSFGVSSSIGTASQPLVWTKDSSQEPTVTVTHGILENASTTPRLSGQITNPNLSPIGSTELVALILDSRGNTIDASKTVIDPLSPQATKNFTFTWPLPILVNKQACDNSSQIVFVVDRSIGIQDILSFFTALASSSSSSANLSAFGLVSFASTTDSFFHGSFANLVDIANTFAKFTATTTVTTTTTSASTAIATTTEQAITFAHDQGNNTAGALDQAGQIFSGAPVYTGHAKQDKVIVLITAGNPTLPQDSTSGNNFPTLHAESVATNIQSKGIDIYALGVGDKIDPSVLKAITGSSARVFAGIRGKDIFTSYQRISKLFCQASPNVIEILSRPL